MDGEELLALAERCEKATEGSRELDARIWCALNGKRYVGRNAAYAAYGRENPRTQVEYTEPPKRTRWVTHEGNHAEPWSTSLDAAMTLVPEGGGFLLAASVTDAKADCCTTTLGDPGAEWFPGGRAATPALTLTAACLRARASVSSPSHTGGKE